MPLLFAILLGVALLETPSAPTDPVRVTGLGAERMARIGTTPAAGILTVTVDRGDRLPPVFGAVTIAGDAIEFRPGLPFVPGVPYRVAFRFDETALDARFRIPAVAPVDTARVRSVFPTGAELPENLLRFYVHFSEPMRGGDVTARIHLEEENGTRIAQAFVETTPELWDPSMRRLTLLLHPGRIKQGLEMHDRAGMPLVAGRTFRLVVDAGMNTASGGLTGARFAMTFRAGAADRTSPDPGAWTLNLPAAGTKEALRIHLNEPVDRAQVSRFILVERENGTILSGWLEAENSESAVEFRPTEPWAPGTYALVIRPELEDLCGNRVDRLFDQKPDGTAAGAAPYRLPFVISD